MEDLLNDIQKFEKIKSKNDEILSFPVNKKKSLDTIFKKRAVSNGILRNKEIFYTGWDLARYNIWSL